MAELFRFFNSVGGDRVYLAEEFAGYFAKFLTSGVYHQNNQPSLEVDADGADMRTHIEQGAAFIQGYMYENTTPLFLTHAAASALNDRIDRIVVRLDRRQDNRFVRAFVVEGTPEDNPEPPELTRTSDVWEISLAQVLVEQNATNIPPENVTDERLDEDVCGLVSSLITIPTSEFMKEWNEWFQNQQTEGFMLNGPDDSFVNLHRALNQRIDERTTDLEYDSAGNLIKIIEKDGPDTVKETELQYDSAGNLETVTETIGSSVVIETLNYDVSGNLAGVQRSVSVTS